jgi:L-ascorbate metabolism protein UlaG (beta-lactamase superfamily)
MLTRRRSAWPAHIGNTAFDPPGTPPADEIALTFIGHSTFLIQLGGVALLTDPIWSSRASPFRCMGPRRVRAPGQPLDALPAIDIVLVSHCHYDHLDLPTLREIGRRWSAVAMTGTGNRRHLAKAGLSAVHELDWWQCVGVGAAAITYVPAQHFSARTPLDRNRALWGGFVIQTGGFVVYFAGDTGYNEQFVEIRRRFPRLDVALLPIGAYEPRWFMSFHHMNPEEAVRAHLDLGAEVSIGMHWGTFHLSDEAIDDPLHALAAARARAGVPERAFRTLQFGETTCLSPLGEHGPPDYAGGTESRRNLSS